MRRLPRKGEVEAVEAERAVVREAFRGVGVYHHGEVGVVEYAVVRHFYLRAVALLGGRADDAQLAAEPRSCHGLAERESRVERHRAVQVVPAAVADTWQRVVLRHYRDGGLFRAEGFFRHEGGRYAAERIFDLEALLVQLFRHEPAALVFLAGQLGVLREPVAEGRHLRGARVDNFLGPAQNRFFVLHFIPLPSVLRIL